MARWAESQCSVGFQEFVGLCGLPHFPITSASSNPRTSFRAEPKMRLFSVTQAISSCCNQAQPRLFSADLAVRACGAGQIAVLRKFVFFMRCFLFHEFNDGYGPIGLPPLVGLSGRNARFEISDAIINTTAPQPSLPGRKPSFAALLVFHRAKLSVPVAQANRGGLVFVYAC